MTHQHNLMHFFTLEFEGYESFKDDDKPIFQCYAEFLRVTQKDLLLNSILNTFETINSTSPFLCLFPINRKIVINFKEFLFNQVSSKRKSKLLQRTIFHISLSFKKKVVSCTKLYEIYRMIDK